MTLYEHLTINGTGMLLAAREAWRQIPGHAHLIVDFRQRRRVTFKDDVSDEPVTLSAEDLRADDWLVTELPE